MISKIPLSEKISRLSEKIFALTKKMSITQFRENNFNTQNIFLILISFSGLFFLVAMYLWSPQSTAPSTSHYSLNESIILFLFIVICILGMFAAIYPSKCKTLLKFQNDSKQKTINQGNMQFEGHHPDCGKFSSHTLTINGRKYCPGCFGLSVGAPPCYCRSSDLLFFRISFDGISFNLWGNIILDWDLYSICCIVNYHILESRDKIEIYFQHGTGYWILSGTSGTGYC
ncbi:hypothetical protein [uncultured Methanobacterium sp.]|uniref:hypothetical protein n=1 Tax=uncultured Methanobacterium sp. TaxID=176306 RepID=UPI002AA90229|nr:hypothetical protein [uncultured Methanobacterium sp.]